MGDQRDSRESSVMVSLKELARLEEQRTAERLADERQARERVAQSRKEQEERARIEDERRKAQELEHMRAAVLGRALDDAQIEAAKAAQIERAKLEVQLRLMGERQAREVAHAEELARLAALSSPRRSPTIPILVSVAAVLGCAAALVFATRRSAPAPVAPVVIASPTVTAPSEATAMNEDIARLQRQIAELRAAAASASVIKPIATKPVIKPTTSGSSTAGSKCPPGVSGIPLCP